MLPGPPLTPAEALAGEKAGWQPCPDCVTVNDRSATVSTAERDPLLGLAWS